MDKSTWKICSVDDCDRFQKSFTWCSMHYQRWKRHGDPLKSREYKSARRPKQEYCLVDACVRPGAQRGYCTAHYSRLLNKGDLEASKPIVGPFDYEATSKKCTGCSEVKPLESFHKVNRASKYVARCKRCRNDEIRVIQIKRRYGITQEDHQAMLAAQHGKCAICGSEHRLCIDHDHSTGKVRKVLCDRCNRALGVVDDDPELLLKLVDYLADH